MFYSKGYTSALWGWIKLIKYVLQHCIGLIILYIFTYYKQGWAIFLPYYVKLMYTNVSLKLKVTSQLENKSNLY